MGSRLLTVLRLNQCRPRFFGLDQVARLPHGDFKLFQYTVEWNRVRFGDCRELGCGRIILVDINFPAHSCYNFQRFVVKLERLTKPSQH